MQLIILINILVFISISKCQIPAVVSQTKLHNCSLTNVNQFSFNVLPGVGWDNLENTEKGRVLVHKYSLCHTSPDGNFLLPDNINIIPHRHSVVELSSELFQHYSNYTSSTARSINVDGNYQTPSYSISGSFSYEHQNVKNKQIKQKSAISRVQLRYNIYQLFFQPDAELDPIFRNRILDIGAAIFQLDNDNLYPRYLAELLVRDFGTHFTRYIDAGALLNKIDVLKESYLSDKKDDTTKIEAAASFSMRQTFNLNVKTSSTNTQQSLEEYENNCATSTIETIGGASYGSNFKVEDWEKELEKNLVAVDRRGEPLYYAITSRSVPEFDKLIVAQIVDYISEAITAYYDANTIVGCMNVKSPNFNDDANVDSGDCKPPKVDFLLGGVYQVCYGNVDCSYVEQVNPITGGYSCPLRYKPVQLQSAQYHCNRKCSNFLFYSYNCHSRCSNYALYWCAPTNTSKETDEGYLFGGFFSSTKSNPITKSKTCPPYYLPMKYGADSHICLSTDKQNGIQDSIAFGGFFSCKTGNPLTQMTNNNAQYWTKGCAEGYSAHVATIDRSCQISYCVKLTSVSSRMDFPLHKPPYINLNYGPNYTTFDGFNTPFGVNYALNNKGEWEPKNNVAKVVVDNAPKIIGYSILGSILIASAVIGVFFGYQKYKSRKQDKTNYKSFDKTEENPSDVESTSFTKKDQKKKILTPPTSHSNDAVSINMNE